MRTAVRDAEFSAFMRAASPSLLRTAWLLTADPEAAQELVRAALVKTYVAWPRVRTDEAVAYARRILVNERTDAWRRRTREAHHPTPRYRRRVAPIRRWRGSRCATSWCICSSSSRSASGQPSCCGTTTTCRRPRRPKRWASASAP